MVSINVPESHLTVKVSIIDTGARISGPLDLFMEPSLLKSEHMQQFSAPAYVFLVENKQSGRRIIFDLGIRKTFEEYSPATRAYHTAFHVEPGVEVFEMLQDKGVDLNSIEAIIWRCVLGCPLAVKNNLYPVITTWTIQEIQQGFQQALI